VNRDAAEQWIRAHVSPSGPIETGHEHPWGTVLRVPVTDGVVWFKECAGAHAFEAHLTAELSARWPDRVAEVLAHDEERAWLLLADAGTPIGSFADGAVQNPPGAWLELLPLYAELQRGEVAHAEEHLAHGVPDLRLATLPEHYESFLEQGLPSERDDFAALRAFLPHFAELCAELDAYGIPESIQHDDLHMANVYARGGRLRVLDWGDSSVAHPFTSLVVTLRFLEEINGLAPDDPWFPRLRDAYLEPWGDGLADAAALALRVGIFAHAIAWARQRAREPAENRPDFDPGVLRRALSRIAG
jgi:hypothetical protein